MSKDKQFKYNVEERFGEVISGEKWGIVPFSLYLHQKELKLAIHDVWFLTWVIIHKWTDDNPYPSLAKLSRKTGYSETYIRDISKDLQGRGLIKVEPRFREDGGQNTNQYSLEPMFEHIEKLIQGEVPNEANLAVEYDNEEFYIAEQKFLEKHNIKSGEPQEVLDFIDEEIKRLDAMTQEEKEEFSKNMQKEIDEEMENDEVFS